MGCDVRFLAEDATVGQPEINLGIIPGAGGTQRLTRLIGPGKARDLVYTGRFVSAAEALDIGLADRVVPGDELDAAALEYATALAAGPTRAIGEAKRAINEGLEMPMDAALSLEAEAFRSAFATRDADEGVTAFLEKRKPRFKGE
jgi:enoyl-CoA hydratase/carnithine racemase